MPNPSRDDEAPSRHRCWTCQKVFSTNSHLRRHESIHARGRQIRCPGCSRAFPRPDTARRHFQTCPRKTGNVELPARKRGRQLRACDVCRSKKYRCDGNQPCERCSLSRAACSYSHVNGSGRASANRLPMDLGISCSPDGSHPSLHRGPAPFLLSYTDPSLEATTDAFAAVGAHAEAATGLPETNIHSGELNPMCEGVVESLFAGIFSEVPIDPNGMSHYSSSLGTTPDQMLSLQSRAEKLIHELQEQHETGVNSANGSQRPFAVDLARTVFTAGNLWEYISAYFDYVHPHFPFLHRPTFDVENVSLPLLLAVFLNGSSQCIPQDDAISARQFFALSEEYIFQLLHARVIDCSQENMYGVETVQAALLMVSLQSCFNDPVIRYRIRVNRHPAMVASVRSLSLADTKRTKGADAINWELFVIEETRVRLVTWIFLYDCMNTVFFKGPPLMTMAEMTGDLPCSTALFEASTESEFANLEQTISGSSTRLQSVKEWVSFLLHDDWHTQTAPSSLSAEPKHLLIIVFALHSVIFLSRASLLSPSLYQPLLRATDRWIELWDAAHARQELERTQLVGFTKYGAELCWLARQLILISQEDDTRCRYMLAIPTDSLRDLHDLIRMRVDG